VIFKKNKKLKGQAIKFLLSSPLDLTLTH